MSYRSAAGSGQRRTAWSRMERCPQGSGSRGAAMPQPPTTVCKDLPASSAARSPSPPPRSLTRRAGRKQSPSWRCGRGSRNGKARRRVGTHRGAEKRWRPRSKHRLPRESRRPQAPPPPRDARRWPPPEGRHPASRTHLHRSPCAAGPGHCRHCHRRCKPASAAPPQERRRRCGRSRRVGGRRCAALRRALLVPQRRSAYPTTAPSARVRNRRA
mmetsp:Transcript_130076/g.277853  ORF Transcript_130076/g.277853 Transcript_130076/m.277853 type:complete len:214 (-) Transcript_130076:645-1286(-)